MQVCRRLLQEDMNVTAMQAISSMEVEAAEIQRLQDQIQELHMWICS